MISLILTGHMRSLFKQNTYYSYYFYNLNLVFFNKIIKDSSNEYTSNKTDSALLNFVEYLGGNPQSIRMEYPSNESFNDNVFSSERKMMSTIVKNKNEPGFRLHAKGAPEIILSRCGYYLDSNGSAIKMTKAKYEMIVSDVFEKMASNGLRTICVAYRDFLSDKELNWHDEANVLNDMICLCLVGIEDDIRRSIHIGIEKFHKNEVAVRLVTGDDIKMATNIAKKCGIISSEDEFLILDSKEFNQKIRDKNGDIQQELFDQVWPKLKVLARSSPEDKYNLVNGIMESKIGINPEVVAMTGRRDHDGRAMRKADVSIAMGVQGTDGAKESSDIIIFDDHIFSFYFAIIWGRTVYDSIAKFLQFQFTSNIVAGVFTLTCAIFYNVKIFEFLIIFFKLFI